MKRVTAILGSLVIVLIFLIGVSHAAEKFAYVDVVRIASEYNKAKDYNKKLEGKANEYKAQLEKKEGELKQLQDKINVLSEKEKEAKRTEVTAKFKELQDFERQKGLDLRKEDFENTKEIVQDIKAAIKQYAEKEGYTLVFDDRALVYQLNNMDITDKIIEILNKGYTKK